MRTRASRLVLVVLSMLASAGIAAAQTAQITGRITDSSAAAVPGTRVVVTSVDTGIERQVLSNDEGYYAVPFLKPGPYRLAVDRTGFKSITQEGIVLAVDQVARIDFVLEVGGIQEEVRVEADAPLLQRDTVSVGHGVDRTTIVTLPLNGRNYSQLAVILPGAVPNSGSRAADGFSVNGNRTYQNSFLIDGVDNNNYLFGSATGSNQALRPPVEAIQEFKVETASYSAESGHAAGGVITVVTKAGTNAFRGSAFEFFRHDALDANDFFANRAGLADPPLGYHQFGGTLGGPLVRNRTFFFASYQGTRERRSHTATVTVPTPEMVAGHFGDVPIYDPRNVVDGIRQPFPNHTIPLERMDPVGRRLASLYPPPNRPGTVNNFVGIVERVDDADQVDVRVDHQLGSSTTMFLRYSRSDRVVTQGSLFGPPGNGDPVLPTVPGVQNWPETLTPKASAVAFGGTQVISSALVHEFRIGYTSNVGDQLPLGTTPLFEEFGIKGIPPNPDLAGLPNIRVEGFASLGERANLPGRRRVQLLHLAENVSWIRGAHALKVGADVRVRKNFGNVSNQARGLLEFSGQYTSRVQGQVDGPPIADLLLGQTALARLTTPITGTFWDHYYGLYINDAWKLSPRLTLNLGLRYELQTPMWEADDRMAIFDVNPSSATFGTLVPARKGSFRTRTFFDLDRNNVAPRAGLAFQVNPVTSVQAAFGIFYGGLGYQALPNSGVANLPYFINIAFQSEQSARDSALVLADGFPAGTLDPKNARNPSAFAVPYDLPIPEVRQWHLGVQRQLRGRTMMAVAYVGSDSSHLRALNNINAPVPGPGAVAARRPFRGFGDITFSCDFGEASYRGLQAKAERRFADGFALLASYTWSHAIDNSVDPEDTGNGPTMPQDPRNTAAENASASIDVRHRFVTSFIYDLPVGRADGLLGRSAVARALVGGWQVGGIFVAQSGLPMTPFVGTNPANVARTAPMQRPDCLRDGNLPRGERTIDRWFDASAFAPAAQYTFGNCGRNVLRGPGLVNLDLLVARRFRLSGTRLLEVRGELFNAGNWAHFARPNTVITQPQAGEITATQMPNRQVQIGVRLEF